MMSLVQGRTAAGTSCRRVLLFGVLPFVAGVWLVLVTFRHQGLPERLQAGQTLTLRQNCSQAPGADGTACDCNGVAARNGTAEGVLASRQACGLLDSDRYLKSTRLVWLLLLAACCNRAKVLAYTAALFKAGGHSKADLDAFVGVPTLL